MRKKNKGVKNEKNNLLIFVDESAEYLDAMIYACEVAEKNKNNIILLYVIEEENFRHWKGVEKIMRDEQKDKAKEILDKHTSYIKNSFNFEVKSFVKTGEKLDELLKFINTKRYKIKNLVLGLAMDKAENNRIISLLTSNFRKKLTLPIIIVPGKI